MEDERPSSTAPHALGVQIGEHRPSSARRLTAIAAALAGLAGAGIALPFGLYRWYFAYSRFGPVVVWRWSAPFLASGLLLAILGGVGLYFYLRWRSHTVRVYSGGLLLARGRGQSAIPWDRIRGVRTASVRYGPPGLGWRNQTELILHTDDNEEITLSHTLEKVDELAETIKRQVYPQLLAEYARAFNQGQPLTFGPLTLTADGVYKGKEGLAWSDLREATLEQGVFALRPASRDRGFRIPAQSIPNVDLCLQFIQHLAQGRSE